MLESGLFFSLGFLCSALFALMVAPAIWRRAVSLTRQRIESSVPLTLNEIQADKDQLRAEFAMSSRKLEVSLEKSKEREAEQLIEVNRRRDEMLVLEEREVEGLARIAELEAQLAHSHSKMKTRENELKQTNLSLNIAEEKLEERALSFEELQSKYQAAIEDFDGQKIEMVARETRIDSVQNESRDTRNQLKKQKSDFAGLASEFKAANSNLTKEQKRNNELSDKVVRLQSEIADMEERLERRDNDLKKLRSKNGTTGAQSSSKHSKQSDLDEALSQNKKLEKEVADTRERMEALLKDASGDNVEAALSSYEKEQKKLKRALQKAESDRDALKIELSAVQISSDKNSDAESRENAMVRERINDLAAKMTAMTAAAEGADSPIHQALKKAETTVSNSRKRERGTPPMNSQEKSLADRIRALQAMSEKA